MSKLYGPRRTILLAFGAALLIGVAAVAGSFGQSLLAAAIGCIGIVLAVAAIAKPPRDSAESALPRLEDLNAPSKTRLKPIVKLREGILQLVDQNAHNSTVAAIAGEMQLEVDSIVVRSIEILEAKKKVQKLAAGVFRSRAAVAELQSKLQTETDVEIKQSLESSLQSRSQELAALEQLELMQKRLEANLDEAEAALAELKAQVLRAAASSPEERAREELEPFEKITSRLRSLSDTMEQSIETVSAKWA